MELPAGQDNKLKIKGDKESWRNCTQNPGEEFELVRSPDDRRGDDNESTREKEALREDGWKE